MRRSTGSVVVLLLLAVGGCGGGGGPGPGTALPSPPPTRPVPVTVEPTVLGDPTGCPVPQLRPVIEAEVPVAEGVEPEVRLLACLDGYAQVLLVADGAESLPVYLRRVAGTWRLVDAGTGLDCRSPESLPDRMVDACRALGLS